MIILLRYIPVKRRLLRKLFCLWVIVACCIWESYAKVEIIDGKDGLSNSSVTAITKDRRGLMWIGTRNGLNIYDGYMFTRPYKELGNLPITSLVYDTVQNIIWVGTDKGLYVVQGDNGVVRNVRTNAEWGNSRVSALLQLPDRHICVAYQNGHIARITPAYEVSAVTYITTEKEDLLFYVRQMTLMPDGNILFCTGENFLYRLRVKAWETETIYMEQGMHILYVSRYDDLLLLGTKSHGVQLVNAYDFNNRTPALLNQLNAVNVSCAVAAKHKDRIYALYLNTRHFAFDMQSQKIDTIHKDYPPIFKSSSDNCIFRDENEILWIGTERGIIKIIEEKKLFERSLYNQASMRAIIEDEAEDLYAGSFFSGLCHNPKKEGVWTYYEFIQMGTEYYPATPFSLVNDTAGYIYIASEYLPFFRFNKKQKKFETEFYNRAALKNISRAFALYMDDERVLWIGSNSGLLTYDLNTNTLKHHQKDPYDIGNVVVRQIAPARDKEQLWIATDNGLFLLHKKQGVLSRLYTGSVPALSNNDIYFVEEDKLGELWLGTNGGGINIIAGDRKQVTWINKEKDGLSNDIVYGILQQGNGNRWISTFNGLSCYNPVEKTFVNYYVTDGLNDNEFNQNSFYKDGSGKMYFGSVRGICMFYPDSMEQQGKPPCSLFISPVSKWNSETQAFTTISDLNGNNDKIVLHSSNASLVFNLGLTDYTDPKANSFSYRVKGLFDDWVPLQGQPVLRLNSIPYGRYTLEIKALNAQGILAANMLRFHLWVKLPFYKTWWFYGLILLLAGVLIYVFFQLRFRSLKQLQQLRVQIASDLHDEVGGLLTRITLFSDNVRFGRNTAPEKETKIEKIAALSRDATTTMSDVLWAIDARNDFAGSLADRMREHAEDMLLPANIELVFDVTEVHQKQKIPSEVRQQLYLIFKEAINNIVKHTRATAVRIAYQYDSRYFLLRIINNGTDKPFRTTVSGQGLKNMEMRAAKIGAGMDCHFQEECFILTIEKETT